MPSTYVSCVLQSHYKDERQGFCLTMSSCYLSVPVKLLTVFLMSGPDLTQVAPEGLPLGPEKNAMAIESSTDS